jgi:hypothetical protein
VHVDHTHIEALVRQQFGRISRDGDHEAVCDNRRA